MHTSQYNYLTFNYNGDYSSTIRVHINNEDNIVLTSLDNLIKSCYGENTLWTDEELKDVKEFVANAAVSKLVGVIEQMTTEEVLTHHLLQEVLNDLTS